MKNILFISPEGWGKSFVSKHHYACELAKLGKEVYFLNCPSGGFKVEEIKENLFLVDYKNRFRGLGKLPGFISAILIKKEVKALEKLLNVSFDTIWNFDTSRFFNLSGLKEKLRICHIVDMAENHQRGLLSSTSDICFCTSDFIANELKPYNEKVFKVHHGYQIPKSNDELELLPVKRKIQVGCVGNLTRPCIDWPIINQVIKEYPEIQFNFVGAFKVSNLASVELDNDQLAFLKGQSNVSLLGQVESDKIPSLLKEFNVLICAYKMNNEADIKQHSNLHKTMEYLGSGNVVVTTYTDEYKDKRELLEMVDANEEFFDRFGLVVSDLGVYNTPAQKQKRIGFALNHAYDKQLDRILKLIETN